MAFFGCLSQGSIWNFPRQDHDLQEFRGFPGMELGIFRVAKSSGLGRDTKLGPSFGPWRVDGRLGRNCPTETNRAAHWVAIARNDQE